MATRRRRAAHRTLPPFEGSAQQGLRLHAAGDRLGSLLQQRERLLAEVRKKRAALEAAKAEAEAAAERTTTRMAPIMAKFQQLRHEIGALFHELLAPGRLSARARKQVKRVHRGLVAEDIITGFDEPEWESDAADEPEHAEDPFPPPSSRGREREARVAPAAQRGQEAGRESLRAIFKRLALAVHPDRARGDSDRERRTEVMKEATRAYEDGDFARLLELEKHWQAGGESAAATDEGRRCAELEQTLRELTRQARELTAELRYVRRQAREDLLGVPLDELLLGAEDELKELEQVRDSTRAFRDGKLSLRQFLDELAWHLI